MGMNDTPSGERLHIGLFGRTNAGKSSLLNALIGQPLAIVSGKKGTTTDPVRKAMELLPIGPVVFIDTPGLDDESALGEKRTQKAAEILRTVDMALLVIDGSLPTEKLDLSLERELDQQLRKKQIPVIFIVNKSENLTGGEKEEKARWIADALDISAEELYFTSAHVLASGNRNAAVAALREEIARRAPKEAPRHLAGDLVRPGDMAVLVIPIDFAAPKGRLILPQQQVIRDLLDAGASVAIARDSELAQTLDSLKQPPKIVITDSQAFHKVEKIVPAETALTSFSILMARYKGRLKTQTRGARTIEELTDGSRILISEGCTHHRQCGDIGTEKLPNWISSYVEKKNGRSLRLKFSFTSGTDFPEDLSGYDLIVHCGGCTLSAKEMERRIDAAEEAGVPITNYGVLIAYLNGILERALEPVLAAEKGFAPQPGV